MECKKKKLHKVRIRSPNVADFYMVYKPYLKQNLKKLLKTGTEKI